jgi:hypothetical protein
MKSKQKKLISLGHAYHAGWSQTDKDRGEFYLTILNDLAEGIDIPDRHTRANLAEVLGWMSREQSHMNEHMCSIHDDMVLLATGALISAMKKGLFKSAKTPRREQPDVLAQRIEDIVVASGLVGNVDKEIICYHVKKAVLSIQHEQQQRPPTMGGENPVEATVNSLQQPARPGPGLSPEHQKGQPVDAGGQPAKRRPKQAIHGDRRGGASSGHGLGQGT